MKLPGINLGNLDIVATVGEFLTVLRSIDGKLDELLDEQREANRNSVLDRIGRTSRERMARDRSTEVRETTEAAADCSLGNGTCADPHDGDMVPAPVGEQPWPGFGAPCDRPLGVRGNCAKSLGHSGRCKP